MSNESKTTTATAATAATIATIASTAIPAASPADAKTDTQASSTASTAASAVGVVLGPKAIEALAAKYHNPELAKVDGDMVYMIFSDGELCSQKCGRLLWQRTLHMLDFWIPAIPLMKFPETANVAAGNSYAFVTHEHATEIRAAMKKLAGHITITTSQ